jgi:replication initiation and membrane attachment protein DnaB
MDITTNKVGMIPYRKGPSRVWTREKVSRLANRIARQRNCSIYEALSELGRRGAAHRKENGSRRATQMEQPRPTWLQEQEAREERMAQSGACFDE